MTMTDENPFALKVKNKLAQVDFAQIFFTDLNGRLMTLQTNLDDLETTIDKGIGFDSSSIAGLGTVDDSDKILVPVPDSVRVIKLKDERIGSFIGKIYNQKGVRSEYDARSLLEKTLAEAKKEFDVSFKVGPEHEFFLLAEDAYCEGIHTDSARYFHADPADKGNLVRKKIIQVLSECGISYEKAHHEVTSSQHEINLPATDPVEASDRTILFNYITKKVAGEYDLHASFMPKPFNGQNRNAYHIHLSMLDSKGKNLFYDKNDKDNLSKKCRNFMGGIIKYARESSIIMASTFNSYKGYVIDREAPVVRGWGLKNRTSMVRIPYSGKSEDTRIELRNPDPAGNAYLQMAILIKMGLTGMREGLDCGSSDIGSTYLNKKSKSVWDDRFLPKCMFEALVEAEKSSFLKNALGQKLYDSYIALKTAEWEEHRTSVTPREHDNYLSI